MGDEEVHSYVGFRTIAKGKVDGVVRPLLNGEFIFMFGTLDQGYWPDGLYTPPTREAMVYDLKFLKDLGFNMVRKHVSETIPGLLGAILTIIDQGRASAFLSGLRRTRTASHPGHAVCASPVKTGSLCYQRYHT